MRRTHLKDQRMASGQTALDLAERLGISENAVYATERGRCRPGPELAKRWANGIGMPLDQAFPEIITATDRAKVGS